MGDAIGAIVIKILPDLEITVKGTDIDCLEFAAIVVSALRAKGLFPDVKIDVSEAVKNAIRETA